MMRRECTVEDLTEDDLGCRVMIGRPPPSGNWMDLTDEQIVGALIPRIGYLTRLDPPNIDGKRRIDISSDRSGDRRRDPYWFVSMMVDLFEYVKVVPVP